MNRKSRSIPRVTTSKRHLVFVSHATYDKWIAAVICEKLESTPIGATAFRDDRDIDGGDSIPESIMAAIRDCSELVVLLTPQSVTRQWVIAEIAMAAILGKRIVPILYHVKPDEMFSLIRDAKAYELIELESYLDSVRKRVAGS